MKSQLDWKRINYKKDIFILYKYLQRIKTTLQRGRLKNVRILIMEYGIIPLSSINYCKTFIPEDGRVPAEKFAQPFGENRFLLSKLSVRSVKLWRRKRRF